MNRDTSNFSFYLIIHSPEKNRVTGRLSGLVSIGRAFDNAICIDRVGVSRYHAIIELRSDAAWISDLGSVNGTSINGHPLISETKLQDGDLISLGQDLTIEFHYATEKTAVVETTSSESSADTLAARITVFPYLPFGDWNLLLPSRPMVLIGLIGIFLFAFLFAGLSFIRGPITNRLASSNMKEDRDVTYSLSSQNSPSPDSVVIYPRIELHIPHTLRVSESKRLSVDILKDTLPLYTDEQSYRNKKMLILVKESYELNLISSSALEFSPAERKVTRRFASFQTVMPESLSWHWTISALKPGDYTILIEGLPTSFTDSLIEGMNPGFASVEQQTHHKDDDSLNYHFLSDGTVEINIKAITSIGLTAGQSDLLSLATIIIPILGTIFTYPIWKRILPRLLGHQEHTESSNSLITPDRMSNEEIEKYGTKARSKKV